MNHSGEKRFARCVYYFSVYKGKCVLIVYLITTLSFDLDLNKSIYICAFCMCLLNCTRLMQYIRVLESELFLLKIEAPRYIRSILYKKSTSSLTWGSISEPNIYMYSIMHNVCIIYICIIL